MNTDTPETDSAYTQRPNEGAWDFRLRQEKTMEKLERERDEARAELSEWRILNGWGGTPEIIHDFIKGQQTRIHHAQDLEEELATVTAQRDMLAKALEKVSRSWNYVEVAREALQSLTPNTKP